MMLSYVLPRRSDLPATFESLNDDTLTTILQFVGNKSYATYAGIDKRCKQVYLNTPGMTKETFVFGYAPLSIIQDKCLNVPSNVWVSANSTYFTSVGKGVVFYNRRDVMDWALQQRSKRLLRGICVVAAEEERYDLLNDVWNSMNNEVAKRDIFGYVDINAAQNGKLNVLKWTKDMGVPFDKKYCAWTAAKHGQLHILQWLREERGLELDWELINEAAKGGQLHVMKWLREQEVPFHERSDWRESTFRKAALKGNLEILQWLHDEGCPWPEDKILLSERRLKPEIVDWCRSNGYGDRLHNRQRLVDW